MSENRKVTTDDLREFISTMWFAIEPNLHGAEPNLKRKEFWYYWLTLGKGIPSVEDFVKNQRPPNIHFPGHYGVCTIQYQAWTCARLPYEFGRLTIAEIVSVLWPDVKDTTVDKHNPEKEANPPTITLCFTNGDRLTMYGNDTETLARAFEKVISGKAIIVDKAGILYQSDPLIGENKS